MFYAIFVVIFTIQISLSYAEFDACSNYTLMKYVDRRAVANELDFGNFYAISDDFLDSGWYRIQSDAGEYMPTEPPGSFRCGTWYPIWLNGTEAVIATIGTTSKSMVTNTDNPINSIDPCTQYSLIQYQYRRAATRTLNFGKDIAIAISDDFLDNGWYRVEKSSCEKMPTSAPGPFHCGTWYPIWLNGQLPTTKGQKVRQTVCMQSFTQKCLYSWNVDIKLCDGHFFVYNLLMSKTALSGYCFGTSDICAEQDKDDDSEPQHDNSEKKRKVSLLIQLS